MAENQEKIQRIFVQRISIVAEISSLNAEQLQNTQQLSGNEMNLQHCIENLDERGESKSLRDELTEIEACGHDIRARIEDCKNRIGDLEQQLSELDQKLQQL